MTRDELKHILEARGVPGSYYGLHGLNSGDGWIIDEKVGGWEVAFFERGRKGRSFDFQNEDEACQKVLDLLMSDWTWQCGR